MGAKLLSLVAFAAATRHFTPVIWNAPSSDVVITNYGAEILPSASPVLVAAPQAAGAPAGQSFPIGGLAALAAAAGAATVLFAARARGTARTPAPEPARAVAAPRAAVFAVAAPAVSFLQPSLVPHAAVRAVSGPVSWSTTRIGTGRVGSARSMPIGMNAEQEEEEDWVRARREAEDQAFYAKREAAQLARRTAWEEEARMLRAEEFRKVDAVREGGAAQAASGEEHAGQVAAEYEERMRGVRARPTQTEEEKREAYNRELLRQIEQANAMDARLKQKNQAARSAKGLT